MKTRLLIAMCWMIVSAAAANDFGADRSAAKPSDADTSAILSVIDQYPRAIARGDADLFASLFWFDDPRLTIIENDRAMPMGREYLLSPMMLGTHRKRKRNMAIRRSYDYDSIGHWHYRVADEGRGRFGCGR